MVELQTRRREMRGDGTKNHDNLGLRIISCEIRFTMPDRAGSLTDPACNNTDWRYSNLNQACTNTETRSSQPNQAGCTPDFAYPLLSSTSFSSSSPMCLFLVQNSTITAEHKLMSSLSISPCHDHELPPTRSIRHSQHTPSTAYTKDSIHPGFLVFPPFS